MSEYRIRGIHCTNCAHDLEKKISVLTPGQTVHIDLAHQTVSLPSSIDKEKLKKIAAFYKLSFEPVHEHEHHAHEHKQEHKHGHSHDHSHDVDFTSGTKAARSMKIVFAINILFSLFEFIFGALFNSAAIISDAVHDLGDAISIGLAWFFQKISTKEADETFSFGHQRFSLLGALITGVVLLSGSALVIANTIPRLFSPEPVHYEGMFWLALVAIVANGYSAWLLSKGSTTNESMLNLHLLEDVLGWIGVLLVSVAVRFTGWYILDPILSIAIAVFIFYKTWPIFFRTTKIFLDAVPDSINLKNIKESIIALPNVIGLSHLHIWSIDGEEHAMAVTISTPTCSATEHEALKNEIRAIVAPFAITHTTIELIEDPDQLLL